MPGADLALAEDVEQNLFATLRAVVRLPGGVVEEHEGFSRQSAPFDNGYFNSVFRARDDLDLDAQIAWFAGRGVPSFCVWTRDEPLAARLVARGFKADFERSPGMAARMDELDWGLVEGIAVHTVTDDGRWDDLSAVFRGAYDVAQSVPQQWVDASRAYGFGAMPWTIHLAYADGAPAAIAMGVAAGGVCGLYCVGTTPAARGRRLGAAVSFAACAAGRAAGCDRAVLFASPEGIPLYRRMGLRLVPIAFSRYRWSLR
jgi:hypothetical protein